MDDQTPATAGPTPVTWTLAVVLVTLFAVRVASPGLLTSLQFVPADPWRAAALPVVGHALAHVTVGHLTMNVLFLLLFGRVVERRCGPAALAAVFASGVAAGAAGHLLLAADLQVGLVGASGGVAAVLGLAAVVAPSHRLAVVGGAPVWALFALWLTIQLLAAPAQLTAAAAVSVGAHAGGLAAGLLSALWVRPRPVPSRAG